MNNLSLKKVAVAIIVMFSAQFYAQDNSGAITTVFPFLNIVTDARAAGMGDVGVASSADGNSIFHNAAKMVFHKKEVTLAINYTPWLRNLTDDIYIGNFTYQQKIDERSAFGAGIKYFNYGEIELTQTGTPGTKGSPYELAVEGAYSLKLSENYSMAVGLRYIRSDLSITGTSLNDIGVSNGFGVDISGYYISDEMAFNDFNGIIRAGFNISNIGPKVDLLNSEGFLPTNLKLGGGFDFIVDDYNQIGLTVEFTKLLVPTINDDEDQSFISGITDSFNDAPGGFSEELEEVTIGFGAEYLYNNAFALRGGYFKEDENKGNRDFFTLGAGFKASQFNVDISYLISNSEVNDPLENTLRFSLSFDLGDIYEY